MNIPIKAKVYCQDQLCGFTQAVILNPANDIVTHVVVKESKNSHAERMVPVEMIDASLSDTIHLKFNETTLQNLPPFFDVEYIQTSVPHYMQVSDMAYMEPIVEYEKKFAEEKNYHIPKNELAVNCGTPVYSVDGQIIGNVDEFLVDQSGGHVTHLVLRERRVFGRKDVFIPVADIESIKESSLRLKLGKDNIEKLPAIPTRRFWAWA